MRPGGPLRGAPTVANGAIYVMSQDNQIYSLKEDDGSTNWSQAASLEIAGVFGSASPAVGQGTVVAGFSSGELNAYRYENGREVWQDALQRTSIRTSVSSLNDIDADPVIDSGQVIAVGQGGRMVALDLITGQRQWELNIAGIDDAVARRRLDFRRHRPGASCFASIASERAHPLDHPAAAVPESRSPRRARSIIRARCSPATG